MLENARKNIEVAQQKQQEQYDRKHFIPLKFEVGVKVLKKDFNTRLYQEEWQNAFVRQEILIIISEY